MMPLLLIVEIIVVFQSQPLIKIKLKKKKTLSEVKSKNSTSKK